MREPVVVPLIRSREVARAQRSGVSHREYAFQPLDLGNGLLGIHPSQYLTQRPRCQKFSQVHCAFGFRLAGAERKTPPPHFEDHGGSSRPDQFVRTSTSGAGSEAVDLVAIAAAPHLAPAPGMVLAGVEEHPGTGVGGALPDSAPAAGGD